tara:strand:+ start:34 stop:234 length:201 start_codon:yes stop_codon:yes gene_type:complete
MKATIRLRIDTGSINSPIKEQVHSILDNIYWPDVIKEKITEISMRNLGYECEWDDEIENLDVQTLV